MPEKYQFRIGDKLNITDLSEVPEGSWVVRETMQFLRCVDGKSITSLTPIDTGSLSSQKTTERFTAVYAGHPQVEKSAAVRDVLNTL